MYVVVFWWIGRGSWVEGFGWLVGWEIQERIEEGWQGRQGYWKVCWRQLVLFLCEMRTAYELLMLLLGWSGQSVDRGFADKGSQCWGIGGLCGISVIMVVVGGDNGNGCD